MFKKWFKKSYGIYLVIIIVAIQFYDAYSSELYSRVQSLYLKEFLIDGKGMSSDSALAYLSTLMLPCYLFIMLAPACRMLADRIGRKWMLFISVLGIWIGSGLCTIASSIYVFLVGNMILNFSNSLDIHNFYIIEEFSSKQQGKMRGLTGGIAALAAFCIPLLRSVFINDNTKNWRALYGILIVIGIIMIIMVCFLSETSEYSTAKRKIKAPGFEESKEIPSQKKRKKGAIIIWAKQLIGNYKETWKNKKLYLLLLFLYGIATAGITFYNEPLLSFTGLSEHTVEKVLMVQPVVCCIVLVLGGRMADRYGWKRVITGMVVLAMIGCLGFVILKANESLWIIVGICYGIMLGGYWSAYHLLELLMLKSVDTKRRGEGSAMITYVNGIGNAIGIGAVTLLLQNISLQTLKVCMVIPVLLLTIFLLRKASFPED